MRRSKVEVCEERGVNDAMFEGRLFFCHSANLNVNNFSWTSPMASASGAAARRRSRPSIACRPRSRRNQGRGHRGHYAQKLAKIVRKQSYIEEEIERRKEQEDRKQQKRDEKEAKRNSVPVGV